MKKKPVSTGHMPTNRFMMLVVDESDSDSDTRNHSDSFSSVASYQKADTPHSSPAIRPTSSKLINATDISKAISELEKCPFNFDNKKGHEGIDNRFHVDGPTVVQSDLESLFSVKKQNNFVPSDKVSDNFRGVPFEKKDTPEFIWVKQYTKVYDVNDPSKTFPIFSHYKNNPANKKNSPKITSIPLVAPSDIKALDLSAGSQPL